ncbi:MAG: selenium-dependent molybdenum cofactor biosynthesis protein YqeB [Acidimicrobiia bacterium]|nr:selenium-dependent molybdenum cofactor biosynthesis protein YqeB [Acidimicrobiia bacterium]
MTRAGERPNLCLIRGGGDIATGVIWRLWTAGWPVVACELPAPLAIRRTVSVATAVTDGGFAVEGMEAVLAPDANSAAALAADGVVGVLVSSQLPRLGADVVVDARLAKRNIDTTIGDAPLVVGLGPGFAPGVNCHAAVETKRGHRLGRVLWSGETEANTGVPGVIAGKSTERVLRAPTDGTATWKVRIGDIVDGGQLMGHVGDEPVMAPFAGTARGLIAESVKLTNGLKIGDVDPRLDPAICYEISDKALAVGGGVVEAVLTWSRGGWPNR